ncbi:leucine-rich repeat domain-containing protein [Chaetoceros tenuissimus]|uniref:Leucine-rich repeat domain-containing protein n=1 Tax=Chaetoceros tenuissimus TaxID=426638 RepID=A0AAD3HB77_9STRA|nr:leucine-rich repeat domain-containing protein [Chaetoceros tenuissimus]
MEGVLEIPICTFWFCYNIRCVIFADTVIRIKTCAFSCCSSLTYIKFSINIEVIEDNAFFNCDLTSVFIPPRCRSIGFAAFKDNQNLAIFHVHSNVELGEIVLSWTKLILESHFGGDNRNSEEVNDWIKNINNNEKYSLHRACSSFQPLKEVIHTIIQQQGLQSFAIKNEIGITPSRYLKENPFANVTEKDIIRDYILKKMGELE